MANEWLRLWHDMPNDPKWRTIAKASGQPISAVIAVYVHMLVDASRNVTRGHVDVTDEDLASALDLEEAQVKAIRDAMDGRVSEGSHLLGWGKRQPKREENYGSEGGPKSPAQRKREQRERDRQGMELHDVTQSHDKSHKVTLDKDKDKDKEESNTMSPPSDDPEDVRKCPVGSLVNLYHECMPENPRVKVLNDKRKATIRARWKEAAKFDFEPFGYATRSQGLDCWRTFFEVCAESDFMTGKVAPPQGRKLFIADIDFIFSPDGFAKILENKYHQRSAK